MKIVHFEMPGALSTSVAPFDFRAAREFANAGIQFESYETNQIFWKYIFEITESQLGLSDFFFPNLTAQTLSNFQKALQRFDEESMLPLGVEGAIFKDDIVQSSKKIIGLLEVPELIEFATDFVGYFQSLVGNSLDEATVISLGINSSQGLAFAVIFSEALRKLFPDKFKYVLGKHDYENFSLALKRDELEKSRHLYRAFDLICYKPEAYVLDLISFVGLKASLGNEAKGVANAVSEASIENLIHQSRWLESFVVGACKVVYTMPLSRNKCYWNKCTFCVQIKKHTPGISYNNMADLEDSLRVIAALRKSGIKYFIFMDEAVSPQLLRTFCQRLEQLGFFDLKWTVRIIADVGFDRSLIESMAHLGCREVLFGLETISKETALSMGKVSKRSEPTEIEDLLKYFAHNNIALFINFIYNFPTEASDKFKATFDFYRKLKDSLPGLTFQFNKFALFVATDIFNNPSRFGVTISPLSPDEDLRFSCEYQDSFGRRSSDHHNEEYFFASLGCGGDMKERLKDQQSLQKIIFILGYMSFGFIHRCDSSRSLVQEIVL
jgi:hypothetical protein